MTPDPARRSPHDAAATALRHQIADCASSALYQRVLRAALDDLARGGPYAALLAAAAAHVDPTAGVLPLRFLAALHRLVLTGRAPELARHYPSVGGSDELPDADLAGAVVATIEAHTAELAALLARPVQTNEIGRCAALVGCFHAVARRTGRPLRLLEIGASAGLNLRFDRYAYDTGAGLAGDPTSAIVFRGAWRGAPPALDADVRIAERRGCDRAPIDPTDPEAALTLRSFVWADQVERLARLDRALAIAREVPVAVERAEVDDWLEAVLAAPAPGVATVVYQSALRWYLSAEALDRVRAAIERAGRAATADASVHWLRTEGAAPLAPRTEVRLVSWTGAAGDGRDERLGTASHHGPPVEWHATPAAP